MSAITYQRFEGFPDEDLLHSLADLNQAIFEFGESPAHLTHALQGQHKILLCMAYQGEKAIGFKLGFQERPHYFESWRGGVLPSYRNQGIAQELLRQQHQWCTEQGFRIVTTIAHNQNIPMLIVNLRNGFEIVGTSFDRRKVLKILLQKWLVPAS